MAHLQSIADSLVFALGSRTVIGRAVDCDVVLSADAVSRHHAEVRGEDGRHVIRDLGSRNGTWLNGERLAGAAELRDGDVIDICRQELRFVNDDAGLPPRPRVSFQPDRIDASQVVSTLSVSGAAATPPLQADRALAAVLEINRALSRCLSLDELLAKLLESLFAIYPRADRGVVLLREKDGDELVPRAARDRDGEGGTVRVSRSLLQRAVSQRQGLLVRDVSSDVALREAHSIQMLPLRSVICAPLIGQDERVLGVIQLQSESAKGAFTPRCLEILAGVAAAATIAVENATLHEELVRQERGKRDLDLAREVQRSFLPERPPEIAGYRFVARYQPSQSVGGDYYGFVQRPDGSVAFAIGDVSGKGVPAALMMARLSSDVRYAASAAADPAAALALVDRSLARSSLEAQFVTMVLGRLDPAAHRVSMAIAGHPPALLRRGGRAEEVGRGRIGLPLNVDHDQAPEYETTALDLEPGDLLLFYTDGLSEVRAPDGGLFGRERIAERLLAGGDAETLAEDLLAAAHAFAGSVPPQDDLTLLVLERRT